MTSKQQQIIASSQNQVPVNITGLASALGLTVYEDANLLPGVSGMISKDPLHENESGFMINVNARDPYLRRRFTIAHECAHFLLHKSRIGDGIIDDPLYRSGLSDQFEFEANNLAADLLMPKHLVKARLSRGDYSASQLAKEFQVSEAAMSVRLRYLYRFDYV